MSAVPVNIWPYINYFVGSRKRSNMDRFNGIFHSTVVDFSGLWRGQSVAQKRG